MPTSHRAIRAPLIASALAIAATALATPASPAQAATITSSVDEYTVTIVDQLENPDGSALARPVVGTYTLTPDDPSTPLPGYSNGGDGGTKSDSGCRTVKVYFDHNSLLGGNIYQYNESTQWCWNRVGRTTSDIARDWWLSEMGTNCDFIGTVDTNIGFYAWIDGSPHSGYEHTRQAHFHIRAYPPFPDGDDYPRLRLWSHSNGTWSWRVHN